MKRIIIIGEGQTEQEFCDQVLQRHFSARDIYIENPTIKKTGGGIVSWLALKEQIERHLLQDPEAVVTTLIDYYGMKAKHAYPRWEEAAAQRDGNAKMQLLEDGMLGGIRGDVARRFVPYVQLHEFEALMFCDQTVFDNSFEANEFADYSYLLETIRAHENPETINDGVETAPSKRLSRIIKGYYSENENNKVLYGGLITHDIGLEKIRSKCPRFDAWITKLENI